LYRYSEDKELAAARKFKKLAEKIAADFEADDAMAALGMGMGSAAQTKKVRDQIMGVDVDGAGAFGEEELVPRSMLEEVVQARRASDAEGAEGKERGAGEGAEGAEGAAAAAGAAAGEGSGDDGGGAKEGDKEGAKEGGDGGDVVKVVAKKPPPPPQKPMRLSPPNETPGERLKRLFREKRERGLARVRDKFTNQVGLYKPSR
jgi:hypothetical protein